jgi:hypothetical protein
VRIGVFHHAPYYLRYYGSALVELSDRGHHIVLARPDRFTEVKPPAALRKRKRVSTALYPWARSDGSEKTIGMTRTARDFARYQSPPFRSAHANRQRAFERVLRSVVGKQRSLAFEGEPPSFELGEDEWLLLDDLFASLERVVPPDEGTVRFIRDQRLDVVVCFTRVNIAARDTEIVKAARHLGVPAGVVVYSWDNLSSKGLLHEHPDRLFVWNGVQAKEAELLHRIDPARIVVTGAVRFDSVFERSPSAERSELLRELGLDPARRTILYLGSSTFVAPREPEFVDRWVAGLRAAADEQLRNANVIVRQHPGTVEDAPWIAWTPADPFVARVAPLVRSREQDLYDQISASDAVVALNTSAEIEAAIVGRPVLTVKAGDFAPGQEGSVHFRYLLAEEGGFVETADTLDEHLEQLGRALADDPLADARRRFLESFVRPLGAGRPPGSALADAIEQLGRTRRARRPGMRALARLGRRPQRVRTER